jgi:hypothetical protein
MAGAAQATAGGAIAYQAAGDLTLNTLTSGAAVTATSTGGSILDGNGAAVNVSAGTTAALQAGNVIGSAANPLDIATVGLTNVNAGGVLAGDSIQINGTTGDNTLHFPLTVPGRIFFNGVLLHPLAPPTSGPLQLFGLSVFEQLIASCKRSVAGEEVVRLPTACGPGVSANSELPAPALELVEP